MGMNITVNISVKISAFNKLSPNLISRIQALNSLMPEYELYCEPESINGEKAFYTATADSVDGASCKHENPDYVPARMIIGFLSFLWIPGTDEAELTAFVHPDYRKSGIFTKMLKAARKECKKLGITSLYYCLPSETGEKNKSHQYSHSEYLMKLDNSLMKFNAAKLQKRLDELETDYVHCPGKNGECGLFMRSSGKCICRCNLEDEESFTNLWGVFTDENYRHRGLATLLINCVSNTLKSLSKPLILQVSSRNTLALSLYEKCGFTTISSIDYYLIRNDCQ